MDAARRAHDPPEESLPSAPAAKLATAGGENASADGAPAAQPRGHGAPCRVTA
jgi:hypothetical protein